jgi:photosystem II stability/assembly factor-like uncharacterized protein
VKKFTSLSVILFCFVLLGTGQTVNPIQSGNSFRNSIPENIRERKAFKRAEYFFNQRAFPQDTIPVVKYRREMTKEIQKAKSRSTKAKSDLTWTSVGPSGVQFSLAPHMGIVSGRVRALAIHPTDPLTIYIGAASGGLWKTTDGGESWFDIGHDLETLSFGAIAIDPNNPETIYAGTGEYNLLGNFNTYPGCGLYKSTNGGSSWTLITDGFGPVTFFSDLAVSPFNSNIVMATLGGGVAFTGYNLPNEGIWRSLDGGITWNKTMDVPEAVDIAFHPTDPNILYAAVGGYMSPMMGFYISNDQGANWVPRNSGLLLPPLGGRMQFDISQSNPNIIYSVIYEFTWNPNAGPTRAFKSVNGGNTWSQISVGTYLGGYYSGWGWLDQGWYDLCIAVDPDDPNHVLIGNIELHRTVNGSTFSPVRPYGGNNAWGSIAHPDYHKLVFAPSNPNILYIGCDGGVYKSTDNGYTASSKNQGLETLQFYRIASHPSNPQALMGGMQDNSTALTTDGGLNWHVVTGSDGMECLFNPNPDTLYTSSQYGCLFRSINGGVSFSNIYNGNSAWVTPFLMHPTNHKIIYTATKKILKSTNAGNTFQVISGISDVAPLFISSMAQSQVNPNHMIFSTGLDHPFFDTVFVVKISTNEGATWNDVTQNIPGEERWIARVETDPADDSTMYVLRTGFSAGNKVWKTTDLGQTWTNISGDLPDLPCSDLFIDPENTKHLYLANDIGVYHSANGGLNWEFASAGVPKVPAIDFDYVKIGIDRYLRVGTHGRSIYQTILPNYCLPEGITFTTQEQIDNFQINYPGCTEIDGDVAIYDIEPHDITNLNGLSNLTSIGGDLFLGFWKWSGGYWGNPVLTSFTGLEGLTSIEGGLYILGNSSLTTLSGLDNIDSIGGSLSIINNQNLTDCAVQSLCDYLNNPNGEVNIFGNSTGCNSQSELAENCGGTSYCLPFGNYYFLSQADIDNFPETFSGCIDLNGSVNIHGSNINNLNGLNLVQSIEGAFYVISNPLLNNLSGLENLVQIGGKFYVEDNPLLNNLSGLEHLLHVGGDLWLNKNDSMVSLTGLDNLTNIGEGLFIGLDMGGGDRSGMSSLSSLEALNNLISIGGSTLCVRGTAVTNLYGLENIDAGSIINLFLYSNNFLSTCEVQSICDFLASTNGYIYIDDNAPGCNNPEEVEAACAVVGVEEVTGESGIRIFPNPAREMITVSLPMLSGNAQLTLFNITGKKLMEKQITQSETRVDISMLPKGMYFLRLQYENDAKAAKIIKD